MVLPQNIIPPDKRSSKGFESVIPPIKRGVCVWVETFKKLKGAIPQTFSKLQKGLAQRDLSILVSPNKIHSGLPKFLKKCNKNTAKAV